MLDINAHPAENEKSSPVFNDEDLSLKIVAGPPPEDGGISSWHLKRHSSEAWTRRPRYAVLNFLIPVEAKSPPNNDELPIKDDELDTRHQQDRKLNPNTQSSASYLYQRSPRADFLTLPCCSLLARLLGIIPPQILHQILKCFLWSIGKNEKSSVLGDRKSVV